MAFTFYTCGLISVIFTLLVIICKNPIHSLLYLITSIISISGIFFSLDAYFIGALEIIIYAGAIIVLFIFVVMMLNIDNSKINKKNQLTILKIFNFPIILSISIFGLIIYAITYSNNLIIVKSSILTKDIGIALFGHYMLVVELVSMFLLSSLIISFHIGQEERVIHVSKN